MNGYPHADPVTIGRFGAVLKAIRVRRGWSQAKLAERANVNHASISRLESGGRLPTAAMVGFLADALEATNAERDSLLSSAGFAVRDPASLLADEPVVAELWAAMTSPVTTPERREGARAAIRGLIAVLEA